MRQIAVHQDEAAARRFAAYLVTQDIAAHAEEDGDGWAIWVRDEDQVDRAEAEYEKFLASPDDPRYQGVERKAESAERKRQKEQKAAAKRYIEMRGRWGSPASRRQPLTATLIVLSVLVTFLTGYGRSDMGETLSFVTREAFKESEGNPLVNIEAGQVWRLVTPIFIHLGLIHILFNMMWLYQLGTQIEARRGTLRYGLMVLAIALVSNFAQAMLPPDLPLGLGGHAFFGGMSGVVFGLLGYVWVRTQKDPGSGMHVDSFTMGFMMVYLVLCMTGMFGPIANGAHLVGLLTGLAIGYIPFGRR